MRLGLLGGTFDPIHRGHLDAALAARDALGLDLVHFIPSHVPPHRSRQPVASGFHRFAMTAIAVLGQEGFVANDLELTRSGPSFSADTLHTFHQEGWRPWQLFFITGVDAFAEIATWRDYPAILDASHFVAVARPGYATTELKARLPELAPRLVGWNSDEPAAAGKALDGPQTAVIVVDAATTDVSSTEVRRRLAAGQPVDTLVPAAVERYIHQHCLYQPLPPASQLHGQI